MSDKVYESFLHAQVEAVQALAAESDLIELRQLALNRYLVRFHCRTLVANEGPELDVREASGVDVGIWLAPDYLRSVDPRYVVSILEPANLFLPNVQPPFCCLGSILPGTPVSELVYRIHDVLSGQNVTMDERDALNHVACRFARNNLHRFPIDTRPLKRVSLPGAALAAEDVA